MNYTLDSINPFPYLSIYETAFPASNTVFVADHLGSILRLKIACDVDAYSRVLRLFY